MKKIIFLVVFSFFFSCKGTKDKNLGNGYILYIGDSYSTAVINKQNTVMIPPEILDYAFDSTFIIAAQRSWDSIPNIRKMTYYEADKAFETSTFVQYWILNKKKKNENIGVDTVRNKRTGTFGVRAIYSNVYGPYKWKEYLQKRKELGVPKELKLKKEGGERD